MNPISRRAVLAGAAALGGAPLLPRLARAQTAPLVLRSTTATAQLVGAEFPATQVWAYATDGVASVPGPEIRVTAGARVRRRLINALPEATSVHWHGIRIDNAMDGAAPLTQAAVETGESFDYDFVAPDPGTYWYHSHNRGWQQVSRGLSGPLIVEDREPWQGLPGAAVREMTLVLDDWLLDGDATIVENRGDDLATVSHGGRMGNAVTVNGTAFPELPVRPGERLRLRIITAATDRIMFLGLPNLSARLIALDGHPIAPRDIETHLIGPAQRADVVIDVPRDSDEVHGLMVDPGNGEWVQIATFRPEGDPVATVEGDVRPLPDWGTLAAPDLAAPQRETLLMEGGAMRGIGDATYRGERMSASELAANGMVWVFNGVADGKEAPMFRATRGRTVQIEMINRTMFPHAIHVHGHHFRILSRDGTADPYEYVRDTVLIGGDASVEIAFVADNPGQWMIHCHMLSHQASGMMGWFEVT